jgi:hypothetical protein
MLSAAPTPWWVEVRRPNHLRGPRPFLPPILHLISAARHFCGETIINFYVILMLDFLVISLLLLYNLLFDSRTRTRPIKRLIPLIQKI